MAKLTVTEIRKQISALEAKAARLTEVEMKASVAKVKSLMESLGVTIEHLGAQVSKAARSAKMAVLGKPSASKKTRAKRTGAGTAKYQDPKTGKTWTGFGRAPAWIASAKSREQFLIGKAPAVAVTEPAATKTVKKAAKKAVAKGLTKSKSAAKKVARAAKTATAAVAPAATSSAKKMAAKAPAAKKAVPRKVAGKKVAKKATKPAQEAPATPTTPSTN